MSTQIEQLAKVANGDMELYSKLIAEFFQAAETDARIRYEYDKETYTYSLDMEQMNAKGYAGWEVVQIFKDVGSNGIAVGGRFGTMDIYQVLYKRPWYLTQSENTEDTNE